MYGERASLRPTTMQLRVLMLRDAGFSFSDVAMILRMSSPTVPKMRVYRMRRRLQLVTPARHRSRVSQLSVCGNNAA